MHHRNLEVIEIHEHITSTSYPSVSKNNINIVNNKLFIRKAMDIRLRIIVHVVIRK